jgi:hypothetical protein
VLLAGAGNGVDFAEIAARSEVLQKDFEGVEPHPRVGVDFAVGAVGNESRGRAVLRQALAVIHRGFGDDAVGVGVDHQGGTTLRRGIDSEGQGHGSLGMLGVRRRAGKWPAAAGPIARFR